MKKSFSQTNISKKPAEIDITAIIKENIKLKNENSELQKENYELHKKIIDLNNYLRKSAPEMISSLKTFGIERISSENEAKIKQLQTQLESKNNENKQLEGNIAELKDKLNNIEKKYNNACSQLTNLYNLFK